MSFRLSRTILAASVALASLVAVAPAGAVVVNFNTTTTGTYTSSGTGNATAAIFKSTETVNGAKLNVRVTGWHAVDQTGTGANADVDTIQAAQMAVYDQGVGVIAAGDAGGANNLHQIDNLDGVDFVMLQFDKAVILTGFGRNLFPLPNITPSDSDAAVWGDTQNLLGSVAYTTAVNLAGYSVVESTWTEVLGGSANNVATISPVSTVAASVWLLGADFKATRNDGFKLSSLAVNYTVPGSNAGAVPEPATWGMMLMGFGMVGAAARRRRSQPMQTVAA